MTLDATIATQSDRAVPDRHDEPAPDPVAGQIVGRYLVLSRLGAGAMGVVLSAYDSELDRRVAVKLLRGHRRGAQADARLQREAQALARLNHPNVVAVHDVGTHEGRVFLAMEFVEGQTLGAWMREGQGPRPWREVVRVFSAAGRGLAAAHAQGLTHRDFKPDNVMLGDDGRVRVMDFGLARTTAPSSSSSSSTGASSCPRCRSAPLGHAPVRWLRLDPRAHDPRRHHARAVRRGGRRPLAARSPSARRAARPSPGRPHHELPRRCVRRSST